MLALKTKYYPLTMRVDKKIHEISDEYSKKPLLDGRVKKISSTMSYSFKMIGLKIAYWAARVWETVSYPYHKWDRKRKIALQVKNDPLTLPNKEAIKQEIDAFVSQHKGLVGKTPQQIEKYKERALSIYASSKANYGPVVIEWAHSLLETAMESTPPKRLVFLARDGIPPYEVAKMLQEKYPEKYGKVPVSLLYLSRAVKDWALESPENKEIFLDYIKQEGIQKDEECLFIDVGFFGSLINPVKDLLKDYTKHVKYQFLVSHTHKAHGFISYSNRLKQNSDEAIPLSGRPLRSIKYEKAGGNKAVHWLEDTHQGTGNSASKLIKDADGKIRPDVCVKGADTAEMSHPKNHLYKHFGKKAVLDAAKEHINSPEVSSLPSYITEPDAKPSVREDASRKTQRMFDAFLCSIAEGKRISICKHV